MSVTPRRLLVGALALAILASCSPSPSPSGPPASDSPNVTEAASPSPSQEATAPEGSGVTGTWDGNWAIDPPYAAVIGGFTMELVQTGNDFSGPLQVTNTDCTGGSVQGTLNGSSITFGWVFEQQPIQFTGTLSGTSMSGTWSALACSDGTTPLTGTWDATKQP